MLKSVQLPAVQPLKPTSVEPQLPLPPFVPEVPAEELVTARQIPSVTADDRHRPPLPRRLNHLRAPRSRRQSSLGGPRPRCAPTSNRLPFIPIDARRAVNGRPWKQPCQALRRPLPAKPAAEPVAEAQVSPQVSTPARVAGFHALAPQSKSGATAPRRPEFTPSPSGRVSQSRRCPRPLSLKTSQRRNSIWRRLSIWRRPPRRHSRMKSRPSHPRRGPEDLMVSLEEEMAKLLGRAPDKL